MQRGSLLRVSRKQGPDVWQFRWSERDLNRRRVYRKKVLVSIGRYADEAAARCAVTVFLAEINSEKVRMSSRSLMVAQLCDHFEQRELAKDNAWRSHATQKIYKAYLTRWILPHWRKYELAEVGMGLKCWIQEQHRYFKGAAKRYQFKTDKFEACIQLMLAIGADVAIPLVFCELVSPSGNGPTLLRPWALVAIEALLAGAALLSHYSESMALNELSKQYARMESVFSRSCTAIE